MCLLVNPSIIIHADISFNIVSCRTASDSGLRFVVTGQGFSYPVPIKRMLALRLTRTHPSRPSVLASKVVVSSAVSVIGSTIAQLPFTSWRWQRFACQLVVAAAFDVSNEAERSLLTGYEYFFVQCTRVPTHSYILYTHTFSRHQLLLAMTRYRAYEPRH